MIACGRPEAPTAVVPPAPTATVAARATAAPLPVVKTPATPAAGAEPTLAAPDIVYHGVSFAFQEALAGVYGGVWPQLAPVVPRSPGPGVGAGQPEHLRFDFNGAGETGITPRTAQILIYPVAHYEALFRQADGQVRALAGLLARRPAEMEGALPLLPLINASETFHTQMAYLDFQNGSGVRYVSQYDQSVRPITNQDIFYTFQGLTGDGQYYVAAFFPVTAPVLTGDTAQVDRAHLETAESWLTYRTETVNALALLEAGDFTPDLGRLDKMLQSLLVEPEPFSPPLRAVEASFEYVNFVYYENLAATVTPERIPAQLSNLFGLDGSIVYLDGVPDYRLFTFDPDQPVRRPSFLAIQPVRDVAGQYYPALPSWQRDVFETLQARLTAGPQSNAFANPAETQVRLLNFQNGVGIRSVRHLPADFGPEPVTNRNVYYTFHGRTFDNRYQIWLQFAVTATAPHLPDNEAALSPVELEEITADYGRHVAAAMAQLEPLVAGDFRPDLALLDSMVETLFVGAMEGLPTAGPAADCVNDAILVAEFSDPNGVEVEPGQPFTHEWRLQNTGDCTWDDSYGWVFTGGDRMAGPNFFLFPGRVEPGGSFDISVNLIAPTRPGDYHGRWQLLDPNGIAFGPQVSAAISVPAPGN